VIFMDRDLEEVLRSQQVMLEHHGQVPTQVGREQLAAAFRQQLRRVRIWLARQPNVKTLFVAHRDALEQPRAVAERVDAFLGGGLDTDAMAAVVQPSLYRQRADRP
jgi:hypothetical protein